MFSWLHPREEVPIGLEEFDRWTKEVIALTRLPFNDSMRFAVATIVLESKEILTKRETALKLEKAAQNQLAAFVFQDVKSKRIMADEQQAKKAAEVKIEASVEEPEAAALYIERPHFPSTQKNLVPET